MMDQPAPQPHLALTDADAALQPFIEYLAVGRDPDLERQLIQKSRQPNILKYTPNDAAKRFGDPAMLQKWLTKGREIHWLLGAGRDLAGILWYGREAFPLPELDLAGPPPEETLAIRLYDGYTGHHLAVPVMKQSLRVHVQRARDRGQPPAGLWLQTDADNPAALATYAKCGYREVARDAARLTMVLPASEIPTS